MPEGKPSSGASIDFAKPFAGAVWFDVLPRHLARPELPRNVLLHAGPPFRAAPPTPVMQSAVQAILFEGLAADAAHAHELLLRGGVHFRPAQDHGIVTPLAQVVSASMLLAAVKQGEQIGHAPIIESPAPIALRFGCAAPEVLQRLREVSTCIGNTITAIVRRQPLAISDIIRTAVLAGDECHGRTGAANEAMVSRLNGIDTESAARLRANPAFILPVLMAAAAAALRNHRSAVDAIGGNGVDFGVKFRGETLWRQVPAQAPQGARLSQSGASTHLPAIGDSAVIDFCGLGGQALCAAPLLIAEWRDTLPVGALARRQRIIEPNSGIVDPERIVSEATSPSINLAILERGGAGFLGRGFYSPPLALFIP
jgi:hypothetical protein